jgi:hypothetical protein
MDSFFKKHVGVATPPTPEVAQPAWLGAPKNVRPHALALNLTLARSAEVVAWVNSVRVYREGMSFELAVARRNPPVPTPDRFSFGAGRSFRLGVGFSDGRSSEDSSFEGLHPAMTPRGPLLWQQGGSASPSLMRFDYWLWPLPTPGRVSFAVEWPDAGVAESIIAIDAAALIEAAARAEELWPPMPSGEGSVSFGEPMRAFRVPDPADAGPTDE